MANVIKFPTDPKTVYMVELGKALDQLIIDAVGFGIDLYEVGGVLSHRLGELTRNLPKENINQALDVYVDIILKKADQDNG